VPIIALLTDFGAADPYVGAMKGAILAACPEATLVDLVHDLPAHDVLAGALALEAAHHTYPAETTFVAVVDPGVGSARRGLALASGGYVFVGPDNGLFTFVFRGAVRAHALENPRLFRPAVSPVFHGRDVFGPVAGHLAGGHPLADVGPAVSDPVRLEVPEARRAGDGSWEASVLHVDRFGNATTSLRAEQLGPGAIEVRVHGACVPFVRTYADVAPGDPCALIGSGGRLEVAVREGSATLCLGIARSSRVTVRVGPR
jgi:S-adenosyl-L-methionine hydrolase (adenosine-forming)